VRALLGIALLLAVLALPAAGADPVPRLVAGAGYPTPGAQVVLYEDPACATHELLWQGGWFTASDAAWWAEGAAQGARQAMLPSVDSVGSLSNRPLIAGFGLAGHGADLATQAAQLAPAWASGNASALAWGEGAAGDEDVCLLSLAGVGTGL
jgi:hypothetical protein